MLKNKKNFEIIHTFLFSFLGRELFRPPSYWHQYLICATKLGKIHIQQQALFYVVIYSWRMA